MSTNFYAKHPGMSDTDEGLHIGKKSGGWLFLFRAHPDLDLRSRDSWCEFLKHPWVRIVAENGTEYSVDDFLRVVGPAPWVTPSLLDPVDPTMGAPFREQWYDEQRYPFADDEFC